MDGVLKIYVYIVRYYAEGILYSYIKLLLYNSIVKGGVYITELQTILVLERKE